MCLRSDTSPTTVVSASQMLKWAKLIQVCIMFKRCLGDLTLVIIYAAI